MCVMTESDSYRKVRIMQTTIKRQPRHWRSWSSQEGKYQTGVDNEISTVKGHFGFVQSLDAKPDDWGGLVQTFGAYEYRGKKIRFSAQLRTKDVDGEAALFMLVLSADRKIVLQDAMKDRFVTGTNDWTERDIVLDVPQYARYINIGVVLRGTGRVWMNRLVVEEVGQEVATTDAESSTKKIPNTPSNLELAASANGNAEDSQPNIPQGWRFWNSGSGVYEVSTQQNVFEDAASFFMHSDSELIPKEGELTDSRAGLSQEFKAIQFRGKRLRFAAWMKAENIGGWAGLTLSCDGIMRNTLSYTNMYRNPVTGTAHWKEYSVVIDIPTEAYSISIAVTLNGNGSLWLSRLSIQEVSENISTTDKHSEPLNLDFSLQI
jgi:hypothetical protein